VGWESVIVFDWLALLGEKVHGISQLASWGGVSRAHYFTLLPNCDLLLRSYARDRDDLFRRFLGFGQQIFVR
jgi:hypothetical protein